MTRYIRKAPQKTCSVPAENERKAGTVPFHMTPAHKSLLLWIPFSCALSYGSVSFMLLNPDITSWPLGARLFLLFYTALLACIPKLAKNNIRSLVLLVLSGIASYAFFSFLLLDCIMASYAVLLLPHIVESRSSLCPARNGQVVRMLSRLPSR